MWNPAGLTSLVSKASLDAIRNVWQKSLWELKGGAIPKKIFVCLQHRSVCRMEAEMCKHSWESWKGFQRVLFCLQENLGCSWHTLCSPPPVLPNYPTQSWGDCSFAGNKWDIAWKLPRRLKYGKRRIFIQKLMAKVKIFLGFNIKCCWST